MKCANCTRGASQKTFFMDIDALVKGLELPEGVPVRIGLMGGEPTLHPDINGMNIGLS